MVSSAGKLERPETQARGVALLKGGRPKLLGQMSSYLTALPSGCLGDILLGNA